MNSSTSDRFPASKLRATRQVFQFCEGLRRNRFDWLRIVGSECPQNSSDPVSTTWEPITRAVRRRIRLARHVSIFAVREREF